MIALPVTAPRLLNETDNPLIVRNELLQADRTGIRCVLCKVRPGSDPIRAA